MNDLMMFANDIRKDCGFVMYLLWNWGELGHKVSAGVSGQGVIPDTPFVIH